MEIEASLFNVLVNCYSIKESPSFKFNDSGKSVVLDSSATKFMENGLTIAKFLTYITLFLEKQLGERLGVNIDKLQTLKINSSNQAKLYNWNILAQELEMLDINLSSEEKRDIIQGDHQTIVDLILRMRDVLHGDVNTTELLNKTKEVDKENQSEAPSDQKKAKEDPKNKVPKAAVDIDQLKIEKSLSE